MSTYHVPVLGRLVAELAQGATRAVDCTAGGGGHTELLLSTGASVMAVDRDPDALQQLSKRLGDRVDLVPGSFGSEEVLRSIAAFRPDFILLDLGVSSHQLDDEDRGFSFQPGVALDMRMERGGRSASDLLNQLPEKDLRQILSDYADERRSRALAREIVRRRSRQPFAISDDLVNAIRGALGPRSGPSDFARIFQAFRIAVNDELDELSRALDTMLEALVRGGIIVVISYHSGEDRLVKHRFRGWARSCICPPELPVCACRGESLGVPLYRSPVTPDPSEVAENPRARSARLRGFRKRHAA